MKLFLVLFVTCLVVSASQVLTVPVKKTQRTGSYRERVGNGDRARAAALRLRQAYTVPATDIHYAGYVIEVGIGSPAEFYTLLVDTGSSNTFCGIRSPYVQTSTSIHTGQDVTVAYEHPDSYFNGSEYLDQVTLAPSFVITNQSIGVAFSSSGFPDGIDGILGLGPIALTRGTFSSNSSVTVPTIMDNLVSQGLIKDQILGVSFAPPTNDNDTNGVLNFGGTNSSLYEGDLMWVPVTNTSRARDFWGLDASCTYGDFPVIPNTTAGIVNTGTTFIFLANDFFFAYKYGIPGAELNHTTGLLEIPAFAIPSMQPLNFTMGGHVFTLDVAAQLHSQDPDDPDKWYGSVIPLDSNSGAGFDFVLGMKFLEKYYSAFDTANQRIGFAPACVAMSTV